MIVYLSGPMRGHPYFNFPKFDAVAKALRTLGIGVMNPAAHDRDIYADIESWPGFETGDPEQCPQFNLPKSLSWDFQTILDCDGVALLPEWQTSAGARAERFIAEAAGKDIWLAHQDKDLKWRLEADYRKLLAFPQLKEGV